MTSTKFNKRNLHLATDETQYRKSKQTKLWLGVLTDTTLPRPVGVCPSLVVKANSIGPNIEAYREVDSDNSHQ